MEQLKGQMSIDDLIPMERSPVGKEEASAQLMMPAWTLLDAK